MLPATPSHRHGDTRSHILHQSQPHQFPGSSNFFFTGHAGGSPTSPPSKPSLHNTPPLTPRRRRKTASPTASPQPASLRQPLFTILSPKNPEERSIASPTALRTHCPIQGLPTALRGEGGKFPKDGWVEKKKGSSSGEDGGMGRKQIKEEYKCCGWDRTSDLRDQVSLVPGVFPLYHTAFTCLFIVHLVLGGKLGLSLGAVVGCVVFAVVSHLAKRFGVTRPHARCAVGWLCGMAVAMRGSKAVCRRGGKVYTLEDVILKGVVAMMMPFWLLRWVISGVSAALPCQRQYP